VWTAALARKVPFVDEWQREELARCGVYWRQIPLGTIQILRQLQRLGTIAAIKAAAVESRLDRVATARLPPELPPLTAIYGGRTAQPPGLLGPLLASPRPSRSPRNARSPRDEAAHSSRRKG
jgi:hypothetical protein